MKNKPIEEKIKTELSPVCSDMEEALNDLHIGNVETFSSVDELMTDLNLTDNSLEK